MSRTSQSVCGWTSVTLVNHQQCIEMFYLMCVGGLAGPHEPPMLWSQ